LLPACLNRPGFVPVSSRTRGSDTDRVQAAAGEGQLPGAAQLGQQYLRAAGPTPRPAASRAAAANRSPVCRSQAIWRQVGPRTAEEQHEDDAGQHVAAWHAGPAAPRLGRLRGTSGWMAPIVPRRVLVRSWQQRSCHRAPVRRLNLDDAACRHRPGPPSSHSEAESSRRTAASAASSRVLAVPTLHARAYAVSPSRWRTAASEVAIRSASLP
jgi:hypothetical protein